jgi:hypothetical protein
MNRSGQYIRRRLSKQVISLKDIKNTPIPMALGVFIQRRKHDRQDSLDVVADQVAEIFIIPKI